MPDPHSRFPGGPPLRERLLAARGVLVAAGLVLLGFAAFDVVSVFYALLGFAVIVAATLVGRGASVPPRTGRGPENPGPGIGSPWIEVLIGKLPDPVIVLDRDGRVLAFNARASAMAPALSRGEAVSLALRVPEIVDAIRRAGVCAGGPSVRLSQ